MEKQITLILTEDEARKILHCLQRTNARNQCGNLTNIMDTLDKVIESLINQIHNLNINTNASTHN